MGHSAGAHLATLTVLYNALQNSEHSLTKDEKDLVVNLPAIQGMILMAGVYNINTHFEFESMRGVEEISAMSRVMGKHYSIT